MQSHEPALFIIFFRINIRSAPWCQFQRPFTTRYRLFAITRAVTETIDLQRKFQSVSFTPFNHAV